MIAESCKLVFIFNEAVILCRICTKQFSYSGKSLLVDTNKKYQDQPKGYLFVKLFLISKALVIEIKLLVQHILQNVRSDQVKDCSDPMMTFFFISGRWLIDDWVCLGICFNKL